MRGILVQLAQHPCRHRALALHDGCFYRIQHLAAEFSREFDQKRLIDQVAFGPIRQKKSSPGDPSHLVLQMIDMGRFLKEFGPHVLHYQAKDLMIDRDGLYERGIFSMGMGWQIPRIPGLGQVDWTVVFSELYRAGYEGDCIIEHEDRRFEGTDAKVKQGFLIARDVLRPYCK